MKNVFLAVVILMLAVRPALAASVVDFSAILPAMAKCK